MLDARLSSPKRGSNAPLGWAPLKLGSLRSGFGYFDARSAALVAAHAVIDYRADADSASAVSVLAKEVSTDLISLCHNLFTFRMYCSRVKLRRFFVPSKSIAEGLLPTDLKSSDPPNGI